MPRKIREMVRNAEDIARRKNPGRTSLDLAKELLRQGDLKPAHQRAAELLGLRPGGSLQEAGVKVRGVESVYENGKLAGVAIRFSFPGDPDFSSL